jgi:uncharacterized protein YybS (DUF2232 family)
METVECVQNAKGNAMFRKLTAIEIAEGALLADIAVVFQFVALFIPVGTTLFYTLNIIIFTVLVLRRGVYVAAMAFVVTVCLVCMVMGPQNLFTMVAESMGGMFLGVAMKRRVPHWLLLLLGVLGGTLFLYCFVLLVGFLTGFGVAQYVQLLQQSYHAAVLLLAAICEKIGLGQWWRTSLYPWLQSLTGIAFTYWWLTFLCGYFLGMCPVVTTIYAVTNFFVRRLGYDVRPFPDTRPGTVPYWFGRRLRSLVWLLVRSSAPGHDNGRLEETT